MSFEDGLAALNLEMPSRVPRTEYSVEGHLPVLSAVTGIELTGDDPPERYAEAVRIFHEKWNFCLFWSTRIGGQYFGEKQTSMGHAVYAAGGTDYRDDIHCPFTDPEDVLSLDVEAEFVTPSHEELVKLFEDDYRSKAAANPTGVNMTGVYTTLVSGLIALFGWDMLLLAAGTDPKRFGDLADRYARWVQRFYDAIADADVPVMMCHDDIVWTSGAFIHPDWYREHVFPNYRKYFAPVRESGTKILYTSDGNYTEFIDDIADAGADGFVLEPTTDMACIAERYGRTHSFIGNADTRILLRGTREQIRAEVERCMDIGKGCPGFFLAVGNHIPPNTPTDSVLYYNEVYEELSRR